MLEEFRHSLSNSRAELFKQKPALLTFSTQGGFYKSITVSRQNACFVWLTSEHPDTVCRGLEEKQEQESVAGTLNR